MLRLTPTQLLTIDEAAAQLRCSPDTIRRRVRKRELEAVGTGRGRRIIAASVQRWIERNRYTGSAT